ncbi:PhoH family protein, partial [Morganella morganii]
VVRHPIVAKVVIAYEAWEAAEQKRKQMLKQQRDAQEAAGQGVDSEQ